MELAPVCIFVAAVLLTPQPWQTAVIQAQLRELSLPVILSACIPFLALATIAETGCFCPVWHGGTGAILPLFPAGCPVCAAGDIER